MGFRVWVQGLGFGVWGLGSKVFAYVLSIFVLSPCSFAHSFKVLVVRLSKVFVRVSQDLYKSVFEN